MTRRRSQQPVAEIVREIYGGEVYEYVPLGAHVVAARGVCGGRPTLKYTRMDARWVMMYLNAGRSPEELATTHNVPVAAIHEVVALSSVYDYERAYI